MLKTTKIYAPINFPNFMYDLVRYFNLQFHIIPNAALILGNKFKTFSPLDISRTPCARQRTSMVGYL